MQGYEIAAKYIVENTHYRPEIGIICGSGLSNLSANLQKSFTIKYEDIPTFPKTTVLGHTGELVFGYLGDIECVCMRGRIHYYEGKPLDEVILPVRMMKIIGTKLLVVTNAAGALNHDYSVGDIMVIQDHIALPCLAGINPLRGINHEHMGPRFVSTSDTYDEFLQTIVLKVANSFKWTQSVHPDATYCYVSGPTYESKAECRFLRAIGGDIVGMSTVPEILAAKHCGLKVLALSLISNKVISAKGDNLPPASHEDVLTAVAIAGKKMESLITNFITHPDTVDYLAHLPMINYNISKIPDVPMFEDQARDVNVDSGFTTLTDEIPSSVDIDIVAKGDENDTVSKKFMSISNVILIACVSILLGTIIALGWPKSTII